MVAEHAEIGQAYLSILPSARGFQSELTRQVTPGITRSGAASGRKYGSVFAKSAVGPLRAFGGAAILFEAGRGLESLASSGIRTAASMEQAQIAFATLLHSGKRAKTFLGTLSTFAAKTPFEMPGLVDAARQLLGAGQAAKSVIPTLTAFGDASGALGLGQDQFNHIMLATTQAMAAGKLQAGDLLQITEAGLPVWKLLSEALGKPVAAVRQLSSQGKLLTADVLPKLQKQMEKDYGGAMGKQSKTLAGLWSTLSDTFHMGLAKAILPLEPAMRHLIPAASKVLSGALTSLTDFMAHRAVPALKDFIGGLRGTSGSTSGAARDGRALASVWKTELWPALKLVGGVIRWLGKEIAAHRSTVIAATAAYIGFKTAMLGMNVANRITTSIRNLASGIGTGAAGGPVGLTLTAALTVGTMLLGRFAARHAAAAAKVQGFTAAIQQDSGALGKNVRALAADDLERSGALKTAQQYGLSLSQVTSAALGNRQATAAMSAQVMALVHAHKISVFDATKFLASVLGESKAIQDATGAYKRHIAALGESKQLKHAGYIASSEFVQGLVNGLKQGQRESDYQAKITAASIAKQTRLELQSRSPSRVGIAIGATFPQGLAVGIKHGTAKYLTRALNHMSDQMTSFANNIKTQKTASTFTKTWTKAINTLLRQVTSLQNKLTATSDARNQLASSISSGLISGSRLSNSPTANLTGMLSFKRQQAANTRIFRRDLQMLAKRGLNRGEINDLAQQGLAALPEVVQLTTATNGQLHQINRLDRTIRSNAKALGGSLADATYNPQLEAIGKQLAGLRRDVRGVGHDIHDAEQGIRRHHQLKAKTRTGGKKP